MTDAMKIKLSEAHKDELQDVEKYQSMAETLKSDDPRAAGILMDISNDEGTHAEAIKYILDKM